MRRRSAWAVAPVDEDRAGLASSRESGGSEMPACGLNSPPRSGQSPTS